MQASLAATDLACRRGDRVLFSGLNLSLAPGEALHVAGPNGIGKSSLLRMIAGLLRPFAGTLAVDGSIGLVDERPALDPDLPLGLALEFWQRIDACGSGPLNAQVMGIDGLLDVPVRYLSTGQRKRAALARLLNQAPRVWLLDEPLNGLDTEARAKLEALVALHCGGGGICLVASHEAITLPGERSLDLTRYAA
jgi:heme exporter protein A